MVFVFGVLVLVEVIVLLFFFFQAEDGIRDLVRSRGSEMCIRDSLQPEDRYTPCGGNEQAHR